MKTLIGLAASLVVNLAMLGTLEWSARQIAPEGVVTVAQLLQPADAPVHVRLAQRR